MNPPILLVSDPAYLSNPFGRYLGEILKTEGFHAHRQVELGRVDEALLLGYQVVVLAEVDLNGGQQELFRRYVAGGGRLLAMRPTPGLADLFGLRYVGPRVEAMQQYLAADSGSDIAQGIERSSLQYHGGADDYRVDGGSVVAWLCDGEGAISNHPAVVVNGYGRGQAAAFTYDLARSVALMRQGNPEWACREGCWEDGDGFEGLRPVDGFLRQSGERWVNPEKIPIPQADEQQRLLTNCLMALSDGVMPLPRLWYLPRGKTAALVMTGDGDDVGFAAFDQVMRAVEEYGGHFSAYLLGLEGDPTPDQVADWVARGHEAGVHVDLGDERTHPTLEGVRRAYTRWVNGFTELYGRRPGPSVRHHWLFWYGWADTAEVAREQGIGVDFNYYHGRQWTLPDGGWVNGYCTGSGLPQRFVKEDGTLLDVFQLLTTWADETQLYRQQLGTEGATRVVREMLDRAEEGYYTFFVANFHPGGWKKRSTEPWARNMMQEVMDRGIPIWSGKDLHGFLTARDRAQFSGLRWDGNTLSFDISCQNGGDQLAVMAPASFSGRPLVSLARDGIDVGRTPRTVAGRDYAFVDAAAGCSRIVATYR